MPDYSQRAQLSKAIEISLLQVRGGFACNSSSTHSIIALRSAAPQADEAADDEDFGWDSFTLATAAAKDRYLAAIVAGQLSAQCGPMLSAALAQEILGDASCSGAFPTVDHQSAFLMPLDEQGLIHAEFLADFRQWLHDPKVLVLGGNDNTEHQHPLLSLGESARPLPLEPETGKRWIARRDEASDSWALFCPDDGAKIRLRLLPGGGIDERVEAMVSENDETDSPDEKLSSPELADIKITDACPYRCEFCYQGSDPEGLHAPLSAIGRIADQLARANVFEVALGGGEPTLHPDFPEILELFRAVGIVPNFTTRNLAWLKGPHAERILRACGAFAYSAQTHGETIKAIDGYRAALRAERPDGSSLDKACPAASGKLTIQHVVGVASPAEIRAIAHRCFSSNVRLTLLGYKESGRGAIAIADSKARDLLAQAEAEWISSVQQAAADAKTRWARIGVDTALAAKFAKPLAALGNSPILFRTTEGAQSCYIDAVHMTLSASSYSQTPSVPFESDWMDRWSAIAPESPVSPRRSP